MLQAQTRFVRSADGTRIAWTESGAGPTVVLAANHITDFKREGPGTPRAEFVQRLGERFRVVRYDFRGMGSSDRNVLRQGQEAWVEDLEAVVRAAARREPVILHAPSGASAYAAVFAAEHPELLSQLLLYGCYSCGPRPSGIGEVLHSAMLQLIASYWDEGHPSARLLISAQLFPEGRPESAAWTADLPQMVGREDALRFFEAAADQDSRPSLARIRTPTLVMATAEDRVILPEWSRQMAAAIPDAVYVELPGCNHIPLPHDPSWEPMFDHLLAFTAVPRPPANRLSLLSVREKDILDGVRAGLSNEAIALQRNISPKTVRNHLTIIFDKLRVNSRTQAALLAGSLDA